MATGDGQVVFTIEMDDSAFQAGMTRLNAALANIGRTAYAALTLGAAQLSEAYQAGGLWAARMAAGIAGSKSVAAAVKTACASAASAAASAARAGGAAVGGGIVDGMATGVMNRSGVLSAAVVRAVQQALAAARRAAGIASPSRLFRDEVGRYLALGIRDGFESTVQSGVLPAIGAGVARMAAAGNRALAGTVLAAAGGVMISRPALPSLPQVSAAALRGSALGAQAGGAGLRDAGAGERTVNVTQNITFEAGMQAPDEVARALRRQAVWGLAGARTQA